jgi:hypothetical protein
MKQTLHPPMLEILQFLTRLPDAALHPDELMCCTDDDGEPPSVP